MSGGPTITPNIGLQIPAYQQANWQVPYNFDLSQLDLFLSGKLPIPGILTAQINSILCVDGNIYKTINAAVAAIPSVGATVYVPPGIYPITATIVLPSNSRLLCADGAVITQPNNLNLLTFISLSGSTNSCIENCTIDGNRANNTDGLNSVLAMLSGSVNATVKGCRLRNGNNVGVYTGTATGPTIQNNQFSNFWSSAIQIGFTGSLVATNGTIRDNIFTTQGGLALQFSNGNIVSGNKLTGYFQTQHVTTSGTAVSWVSGTTFTALSPGMYLCIGGTEYLISAVSSSTALTLSSTAGTQTNVLSIAGSPDLLNLDSCSNNTVSANTASICEGYGIVVHNDAGGISAHNVIAANCVSNTGGSGIALNSASSSPVNSGTVVTANAVSNAGLGGGAKGSQNRSAIEISGAGVYVSVIDGNDIYDDQGSPTTLYGIFVDPAGAGDSVIGVNAISGTVTGKIGGANAGSLVQRLRANQGTAFSGADAAIVLSAGFGSTGAVSVATGYDQAFSFTVTPGGSGIVANPTITITFKDGTWTNPPQFHVLRNDTNTPFGTPSHTVAVTATALVITFNGTPTSATAYKFICMAMGN